MTHESPRGLTERRRRLRISRAGDTAHSAHGRRTLQHEVRASFAETRLNGQIAIGAERFHIDLAKGVIRGARASIDDGHETFRADIAGTRACLDLARRIEPGPTLHCVVAGIA